MGQDGTIFLANGPGGLIAYTYSDYTDITDEVSELPIKYELLQNYPNPFNPSTNITFSIPKTEFVTLKVYNILAQEIATLLSKKLEAGNYNQAWNASSLSSGVYVYLLKADDFVESRKMLLLR